MWRSIFCIFLFLLCSSVRLPAQPPPQFIFSHLSARDGLLSDEVTGVVQDRKGFIWISSVSGLQRYDGQRFITFRHSEHDPKSISTDFVVTVVQGDDDKLWMLFTENKVGYVNQKDLTYHEVPIRFEEKNWPYVPLGLFRDNDGHIIISAFTPNGVYCYDKKKNEFSKDNAPFAIPKTWSPNFFSHDRVDGNYWITCDSGLVKYNPKKKTVSYAGHNSDHDDIIEAFSGIRSTAHPHLDDSDRFWIVSWPAKGPGPYLYMYDRKTRKMKEWEQELFPLVKNKYHEIHNIIEQDDGTIWLVGLNIFAKLVKGADKFQAIPNSSVDEYSIRFDVVRNMFEDKENNIWVSTDKGLFWFNPSSQMFQVLSNRRADRPDTVYTPDVSDIYQTKRGEILVNTWGNGMFAYDNKFNPIDLGYVNAGLKAGEALSWSICQRSNGDLWRTSQDGSILVTKAGTNTSASFRDTIFHQGTARQMLEDRNGNLWFGGGNGRLIKWDSSTHKFSLITKLSTIFRLYTDKKGDLWVCYAKDGVVHINPDNGHELGRYNITLPAGKKLMQTGANDIVQYNDSLYFIASGGMNILNIKNGNIKFLTTEGGLPSNSVNNIVIDRKGFVWLTTSSRLCRYSYTNDAISTFNEEDGIPPGSFNVGSARMLKDGRIAFGRAHDVVVFDPAPIQTDNMPVPGIEITGFSLMNAPLRVDSLKKLKTIQLRYNENSITIEFSTLTYHNHFFLKYMLEGLDKTWTTADANTQAVYNYLPPGDYTFIIKQSNSPDDAPIMSTLKISVRAPFWKAWWFYSFLALLGAGLIYWEDRERVRRKESIQKMRTDIAGNLHEEVNITLNNINVLSEIARIKADKDPEQSKTYINEIHEKSHHMIIAMDDMLWSIDPENDNMSKTIDRIKEFADALRNRHGVTINLQADPKVVTLKADMKTRHEVMIIYKLALRLLVEEMIAPQTSIQLDVPRSQLQLTLFAHYKKLPDTNNRIIQMIEEMKERASSIGAVLELQSDEKGTAIILVVKS